MPGVLSVVAVSVPASVLVDDPPTVTAPQADSATPTKSFSGGGSGRTAAIIGAVVGTVCLLLAAGVVLLCRRASRGKTIRLESCPADGGCGAGGPPRELEVARAAETAAV